MDYLEELTNEYDNVEDIMREQGVDMGRQDEENEDE
jgi:hypothetical protein|tara:strand:+ start:199 stop:306 length:108 start_codon:yes stop_codon:yes gene_type:complete